MFPYIEAFLCCPHKMGLFNRRKVFFCLAWEQGRRSAARRAGREPLDFVGRDDSARHGIALQARHSEPKAKDPYAPVSGGRRNGSFGLWPQDDGERVRVSRPRTS